MDYGDMDYDYTLDYGALPLNASYDNLSYYTDDASASHTAADILGIWVTGTTCVLGAAGNVLSFIVLWRAFSKSPMFFVLRAIAVSDAIFLLTVFVMQTFVNLYPYVDALRWCDEYRGHIQYWVWPALMITQMSTVWLTVLVSVERYVAICHPLRAASVCTLPNVRRSVTAIYLGSIVFNIPRYFEYSVLEDGSSMYKTEVGNNEIYRYLYTGALYALLLFLLPLAFLVYLNARLILALREGKRQWKSLQFRQKKEQNLTFIPLTIVLIFFVCGTPSLVVNITDSLRPDIWGRYPAFMTFMVVSNFLIVLNSACNFIIYCLLGQKFRDKLKELCRCQYRNTNYRVVHHLVSPRPSEI